MPPLPWPSIQSAVRASILALLAFVLLEFRAADTAHALAHLF